MLQTLFSCCFSLVVFFPFLFCFGGGCFLFSCPVLVLLFTFLFGDFFPPQEDNECIFKTAGEKKR